MINSFSHSQPAGVVHYLYGLRETMFDSFEELKVQKTLHISVRVNLSTSQCCCSELTELYVPLQRDRTSLLPSSQNLCQSQPTGEFQTVPTADRQTSWGVSGGRARRVCPAATQVSFSDCIWAPDHLAGASQSCWILVRSQMWVWGPLRLWLGSEVWTPQGPRLWAAERPAKSSLEASNHTTEI